MWTKQKRKSHINQFILPFFMVAVLTYFGYHLYHGEYGLYSRKILQANIMSLQTQLHELTTERKRLQDKVNLLKDGTIEKDMLDEYVRRNLSVSRPNEVTIITNYDGTH